MELRHLRYFVAVADAGTMTRAAARLHVAQQALSRQLADLERELGTTLFVRHPRGMALTRAGEELLAHAHRILAECARAVEHVRRLGPGGATLQVGLVEFGAGFALLQRAVAAFRAGYPHATLRLVDAGAVSHVTALAEARLDVGLHLGFAPDASVDPRVGAVAAESLWSDPLVGALLAPTHQLAARAALEPADLTRAHWVGYAGALATRETADEVTRLRAAGWRGRLDHEVDSIAAVRRLVAFDDGWVHVPRSLAIQGFPGTVFRPLAGGTGTPWDVYAVTRAGEAEPGGDPLAAAFLACLREARDELAAETPVA